MADAAPAIARPARSAAIPLDVVPDVPSLAPGVILTGEMEESAFEEPQYLVQRDGRFMQLTEGLYRIVAAIDGRRALREVAEKASEGRREPLDVEKVRQLIASKLIPIGLVAQKDGTVLQSNTPRSLLQINARMAMIPQGALRPVTRVFAVLFWPPIMIPLALLGVAAVGWVLLVRGVGGSVHAAFYTPGLLLAAFAVIVAAAFFHEFGHAAGLKAGGKDARLMGVGLYLAYPAFYTDTTDNYALPRWARVRTDLGGIYFHLLFAVVAIALALAFGSDFLLFVVVLIALEIAHQLIPLVRLDGYWTLADIIGVPDFFSQMGAFVRRVLPFAAVKDGRKLPRLRWWATLSFGAYMLIVIPLLGLLLLITIGAFPRLVATALDAARQMLATIGEAAGRGEWLTVAAAAVQLVFIAIPMIGVAMVFVRLAKRAIQAAWAWSAGSAPKRTIAIANGVGIALLLAFLWIPLPGLSVGTVRAGALGSHVAQASPVTPQDRGTIGDAVPVVNTLVAPFVGPTPQPSPSVAPSATPATTPTATASSAPATVAPTPVRTTTTTAAPTVAPTVAPTPIPSATGAP